eukprot:scaffold14142_cov42-Phaeocystis_antarctica.AAC.1
MEEEGSRQRRRVGVAGAHRRHRLREAIGALIDRSHRHAVQFLVLTARVERRHLARRDRPRNRRERAPARRERLEEALPPALHPLADSGAAQRAVVVARSERQRIALLDDIYLHEERHGLDAQRVAARQVRTNHPVEAKLGHVVDGPRERAADEAGDGLGLARVPQREAAVRCPWRSLQPARGHDNWN